MTPLFLITSLVLCCVSFVCGGLYFMSHATARAQRGSTPQEQKVQRLLGLVGKSGAAVVTEDGGETFAVVTCSAGAVKKVRVYTPGPNSDMRELGSSVGSVLVEHLTGSAK